MAESIFVIQDIHRSLVDRDYTDHFRRFFDEAIEDSSFYSGDQWSDALRNKLTQEGRRLSTVNLIKKYVDKIHGYISENFKDISVTAVKDDEQDVAGDLSNVLNRLWKGADVARVLKLAMQQSLIHGVSYLKAVGDFSNLNEPSLMLENIPFDEVIFSPYGIQGRWENTEYIVHHRIMSRVQLVHEFPDSVEKIDGIISGSDMLSGVWVAKNSDISSNMNQDIVRLRHELSTMYRLELRNETFYLSGKSGLWFNEQEAFQLANLGDEFGDTRVVKKKIYMRYEFLNGKLLKVMREPFDVPTIIPFFCTTNINSEKLYNRIMGVVRNLKGLQKDLNTRNSQIHDIVESQLNGGWFYKLGSIKNPDMLRNAGQGAIIGVTGDLQASLRRVDPVQIPTSHVQMIEMSAELMSESIGISREALANTKNESGLSILLQQQAGNQSITPILDNFDEAMLYVAKLFGYVIQLYDIPALSNILGISPEEIDPRFFMKSFLDNNLTMESGKATGTQRSKTLQELLEMRKGGIAIPDEVILSYVNLTDRRGVVEKMTQIKSSEAEEKNVVRDVEFEKIGSEIEESQSKAFKDKAQGIKHLAEVGELRKDRRIMT